MISRIVPLSIEDRFPAAALVRISILLALLLLAALPARADPEYQARLRAILPHDPDFFVDFDFDVQDWMPPLPMPDLSKRPPPRDSRLLSGAFAPDPQGTLRMFTVGGGPRTSTCIGEPVSALCAVETMLAGRMGRNDHLLSLAMGPHYRRPWFEGRKPPQPGITIIYRILDVKQIGPDDLKGPRPYGVDPWRPYWFAPDRPWHEGDLHVQVLHLECESPNAKTCKTSLAPTTYLVRKIKDGHWAVTFFYRAPF